MAGLTPLRVLLAVIWLGAFGAACASDPVGSARRDGAVHVVQPGENLYRIGKRYGLRAEVLREVNDIDDVTTLQVGQRLWIPPASARGRGREGAKPGRAARPAPVPSETGVAFRWPLRGTLTSAYGTRGGKHEGIDIAAPSGTAIVAAEAGKVIFVGRLGDYGKMVIIKHAGDYRSVYAHVRTFHVRKGSFVERGQRIAEVGATGNASGPHLHFEIRNRDRPRDPLRYLP